MSPMPRIVYGTAWKKERSADLVYAALKAGFRGVDTACQPKHYREDLVGRGIKRAIEEGIVKRDELFIQTKFTSMDGQDRAQPLPYDPLTTVTAQVQSSLQTSLRNLGVTRIDSVVLHSPLRTRALTLEAWRVLEGAVDAGIVGAIGMSNCYDAGTLQWLNDEARVKIAVVQNRWHEGNGWDWDVVDWCRANRAAYQSFWTLTGSPSLLAHPLLGKIARRLGTTREAALYRICQAWGITPLCGSTTPQHVREALDATAIELPADDRDVATLYGLLRGD